MALPFGGGRKTPAIENGQNERLLLAVHYWWNAFRPANLRVAAQFLFDAQELVVFRDAVGAAGRSGLDLTGARGHHEIGDERVFGFAGAMRDDVGVVRRRWPSAWPPAFR